MISSSEARKLSPNRWIDGLLAERENAIFDSFEVARDSSTLTTEEYDSIGEDREVIGETDYEKLAMELRDLDRKKPCNQSH